MRTLILYDKPFTVVNDATNLQWTIVDGSGFEMCRCQNKHVAEFICSKLALKEQSPFEELFNTKDCE